MFDIKEYLGKVIPPEIAQRVWMIVSKMDGYKSICYVDNGCIINLS